MSSAEYDRMSPWLWLDLETSGLDTQKDFILEVYVAVTDQHLQVWDKLHIVLHHPYNILLAKASTWCKGHFCSKSHGGNGLFDECNFSNTSHLTAERMLWNFFEYYSSHEIGSGRPAQVAGDFMNTISDSEGSILHPHEVSATKYSTTAPHRSALLAGSTVHFDRQFLLQEFPSLRKFLSHKSIDVTSILETHKRFRKDLLRQKPTPSGTHRAGDDILDSINLMRFFKNIMLDQEQRGHNDTHFTAATSRKRSSIKDTETKSPGRRDGYYRNLSKTYNT
ncbi:unnamed protein product [Ectocarpus sp. 6 AP-2014]